MARITERQVPMKPVAACRRGTLQSIADFHPTPLLINEPRWSLVGIMMLDTITTYDFNLLSSRVVQGPLPRKGSYKIWARSRIERTHLPGTARAISE